MGTVVAWLMGIAGALIVLSVVLALSPKPQAQVGISQARLRPCPGSPNCVCSEFNGAACYIAPMAFTDDPETAWARARQVVLRAGGTMQAQGDDYLWAHFTSKALRFVDDLELRMDADNSVIHVRSAARVGYSDLGVNRKRIERIRSLFNAAPSSLRD